MSENLPPLPEPDTLDRGWELSAYSEEQMKDYARAAIERQSVPAGYVLVPIEPTEFMLRAGAFRSSPSSAYKAFLAAAPQPQQVRAFLLRDLEKELNVSVPELSLAIARRGMGNYSTNMEAPTEVIEAMRSLFAQPQPVQPAQERCKYCDGTGDVHSITGEWRGSCGCEAGKAQPQQVQQDQCPECDGTGTVAGSQAHFPCPICTSPQEAQPQTQTPDMFWNSDDADQPHDSIECFLNDQICQHDLEVGAVFTIWRAKKLPSVTIRVTAIDEEECEAEYEVIEKAHGITKGTT